MKCFRWFFAALAICLVQSLHAQVPQFMNYQGVARDDAGKVLQDKALSLRLSIVRGGPNGEVAYSETHPVVTNSLGLFTLQVGGGQIESGLFSSIQWARDIHWLRVEMDESGGRSFRLMGTSQLLSVPYAFSAAHAQVASRLESPTGGGAQTTAAGSPGTPWVLEGNVETDPTMHFVGTTDRKDLVFRTSNVERMRLTYTGNYGIGTTTPESRVAIAGNLTVGAGWAGSHGAPENGALIEGRVGINEPNPVSHLDVGGGMVVGETFSGLYQSPLNGALIEGSVGIGTAGPGSMLSVNGGLSVGRLFSGNTAPSNGAIIEGRLGLGTSIPASMLGVAGGVSVGSMYAKTYGAPQNGALFEGTVGIGTTAPVSKLSISGNLAVGSGYAGTQSAPADGALFEGSVGVGTVTPSSKLSVSGGFALGAAYAGSNAAPSNGAIIEGSVGIGTNAPQYKLEVIGNTRTSGNALINGTLDVDGIASMRNPMQSTAPSNGALVVSGGAGIGKDLFVGNDLTVMRNGLINGDFEVKGTSTFKDLIVTNNASIGNDLTVSRNATIDGLLRVNNTTQSTSTTTGAAAFAGGLGVGKNVHVGGDAAVAGKGSFGGAVTISPTSMPSTSQDQKTAYPLYIKGARQGIAIEINTSRNGSNSFASFWDTSGKQGSIDGQTATEILTDPEWIIQTIIDAINLTFAITDQIASATSVNVCAGLGVVTCPPIVSFNIGSAIKIAVAIAQPILTQAVLFANVGVSYSSGSADYAEWLPRADASERLMPGDIVGVRGGKISRNMDGADHFMVVSTNPAVIGNQPQPEEQHLYEKVGFLGQVPAKVLGPVGIGDYIIPSGRNDGTGVAKRASEMTIADYGRIVGRAWSVGESQHVNFVNVLIAAQTGELADVAKTQQTKIDALSSEVASLKAALRELVPDLDERLARVSGGAVQPGATPQVGAPQVVTPAPPVLPPSVAQHSLRAMFGENFIDRDLMAQAFASLEQTYRAQGVDVDGNEALKRLLRDRSVQHEAITRLQQRFNETIDQMDTMQRTMSPSQR